ncbi:methionine--tRNA ligase [Novosphingobium endophyticum]|uniref:Methionine--tRNA ligase n=1 Tax=Novosphingobium endophyticum TaxID=1955250 RepID=A0A916X568_9SPHN|nr:methionine--tRNA ligase [Novosphingobium endophyticum]GGB98325.1 methionine--tRNA ligase [Novosphingobium endophyticum]
MAEPYYITTAISYPNGRPHIGHAYEAIAADIIARHRKAEGYDVRFQTGTDEHGLKMAQKARDLGMTPADLASEMSQYFIDMCDTLNVGYDVFLRTTEPRHHAASQELWRRMEANGDLYLDRYEGWYSVRDEAYYDESELIAGEGGEKLSPQGTPVEWTVEESWFFRLSKYQDKLLELYGSGDFIRPESRRNEISRFVEGGLRDLSVSRTSFDWGVKVPGSENHVMYVWVDALTNYLTGLGFPDESGDYAKYWPADLHLIGKDIVRFHTVYWPAFLMSAGLPLPKQVFGHGFLLNRGQKESKSLGNVTDPIGLAERFGVDALRYFLMREVAFGQDGSYSPEAIVTRCNAELANSFGNLAQRSLSMIFKNMDGNLKSGLPEMEADTTLFAAVSEGIASLREAFMNLAFSDGLESWMRAVFACNQYVDEQAPWALRKTDPERMEAVLMVLFHAVRDLAIAVRPVVPGAIDKLLDQMGQSADSRGYTALEVTDWFEALVASGFKVDKPQGVFPRLELPEEAPA